MKCLDFGRHINEFTIDCRASAQLRAKCMTAYEHLLEKAE